MDGQLSIKINDAFTLPLKEHLALAIFRAHIFVWLKWQTQKLMSWSARESETWHGKIVFLECLKATKKKVAELRCPRDRKGHVSKLGVTRNGRTLVQSIVTILKKKMLPSFSLYPVHLLLLSNSTLWVLECISTVNKSKELRRTWDAVTATFIVEHEKWLPHRWTHPAYHDHGLNLGEGSFEGNSGHYYAGPSLPSPSDFLTHLISYHFGAKGLFFFLLPRRYQPHKVFGGRNVWSKWSI